MAEVNFNELSPTIIKLAKGIGEFNQDFKNDAEDVLIDGVVKIKNKIIKSMQNTKRRHFAYTVKRGGKEHWPSAPNNPPAIDSGDLLKSILFDARDMEVEIGSDITKPPYPMYLEFGTKRMTKRPWLTPAIESNIGSIRNKLIKRMNEELLRAFYDRNFL